MVNDGALFTSSSSSSNHLRGGGGDNNVVAAVLQWMMHHENIPVYYTTGSNEPRRLQQQHDATATAAAAPSATQDKSFAIMLAVLVALILLFFVICTYQVLRIWLCRCLCKRDLRAAAAVANNVNGAADTVLVHDGRAFNLTGDQRRAVLEAIFSETSKVPLDTYSLLMMRWVCVPYWNTF